MRTKPSQFIGESIDVYFDSPPLLKKSPACPQRFAWRGETYTIQNILEEWVDTSRRGNKAHNMTPPHLARAASSGSWGVGRFFFRVVVSTGKIFEIYYDRAPRDADNREGGWFLMGERVAFTGGEE